MLDRLNHITVVLVHTSHPGNIGAAARAMKTMGLSSLTLVAPSHFPHVNATAMAAGADDILAQARVFDSLAEAVQDYQLVLGTSARLRRLQLPPLDPREGANLMLKQSATNQIALVFGRESSGLTNEELELCAYQIAIPSNPQFSSLNLAAAVQLLAYEIHLAARSAAQGDVASSAAALATSEERVNFYQHLEATLTQIDFFYHDNRAALMAKLKLMFNRAQLASQEIKILHGILSAVQRGSADE